MDKLILKMPKFAIEKYINEHFAEITEEDFWNLINAGITIPWYLYEKNLELLKNDSIAQLTYEQDVRVIKFFDKSRLTYELCKDAVKKGYVATEEDILYNSNLKDDASIMKVAILHDPKLIRYITKFCGIQFSEEFITKTLNKYKITEADLINNPELREIYLIMTFYPEYKLYYTYISQEEKIEAIKESLLSKDFAKLKKLPFFQKEFNAKIDGETSALVASILTKYAFIDDIELNSEYYEILNSIVDGAVNIRYKKDKNLFKYSDVVMLNDAFNESFNNAKINNTIIPLKNLANDIYQYVNIDPNKEYMDLKYIEFKINELYNDYVIESKINRDSTTIFYNEILNKHRNCYCSIKKTEIMESLKNQFDLTNKKKLLIYNGRKIEKISEILKSKEYEILGLSKEELLTLTKNVEEELLNNKDIVNNGINLNENVLNQLSEAFINGNLNYDIISNILNTDINEVIEYVFRKYELIKLNFLDQIHLSDAELVIGSNIKEKLGLNVNNFDIAGTNSYLDNIAKILLEIDEECAEVIKNNASIMNYAIKIIPFINLLPEFNTEMFIKILKNYNSIKDKTTANYYGFDESDEFLLNNFQDTINLANGYSDVSSLHKIILGNDIVNKIGVENCKEYFDFYLNMLKKVSRNIPQVKCEINGITYISGDDTDSSRLLIGKNYKGSCVDLESYSGKNTFIECLLGDTGDVIMIRDLSNPKFFLRALVFRRGNVVQIAKLFDENWNLIKLDDIVLDTIATQIISQSELSEDNIDYVFVPSDTVLNDSKFNKYQDFRFVLEFPHADFDSEVCLLKTSNRVKGLDVLSNLDFAAPINISYFRKRKDITKTASNEELSKIKALSIAYEEDVLKKEMLESTFTPFYRDDYLEIISGEDWYVALNKNGEIESVLIPTNNPVSFMEYAQSLQLVTNLRNDNLYGMPRT